MKKSLFLALFLVAAVFSTYAQWVEQATGFATASRGIKYICPVDENIVWATAYNGTSTTTYITEFTRTSNGGTTWTPGTVTGYTTGWGSAMIFAIDANTAWMPVFNTSAGGGRILKTTDGGATWTHQTTATFAASAGFPNTIHFWDANNGWCMGDPNGGYFEIYTTTDGGTTWVRTPTGSIPAPSASDEYGVTGFYSVVGDNIWFSTNKGRVFKSTDRGLTWSVYTTGLTNQFKVIFRDALHGIAYQIDTETIAETSDGGETWTIFTPAGNCYSSDIAYVPGTPNTWVTTGNESGASFSLYGCHMFEDFSSFPGQMLTTAWVSNSCGYVGNFNTDATTGGMYKFTGTITDPFNNDVGVIGISNPVSGAVLSATENIELQIMNLGLNPQTGFDVSYSINGGAVVTETVSATIDPGATYIYTFTATEDFSAAGTYDITAYSSLSGDENTSNDNFTTEVLLLNWLPEKRVVGEEATGTWCGWCVRGHVYLEQMATDYPDSWIGIAVHNGDPMVVTDYDAAIGGYISGYPSGLVDRAPGVETDPLNFEDAYLEHITEIPLAAISVENVTWNSGTREITFDVTSHFACDIPSANYRLNAVIIENNVTGTTTDYDQANYYSGGTYGAMGGYESLANPVPAAQMTYQNVARAIMGGWEGTAGSVPSTVAEDDYHTQSYSYTLPAAYDENEIKLVGMIIDQSTGAIMNANTASLPVSVGENFVTELMVYPNPSNGIVYVRNAENADIIVTNILGDVVASFSNINSNVAINLNDQAQGTYIVKITENGNVTTRKIVISK